MSLSGEIEQNIRRFKEGFENGRLGHAYLMVGNPRGNAGRLVESILQMLYCEAPLGKPRDNLLRGSKTAGGEGQVLAEPSEAKPSMPLSGEPQSILAKEGRQDNRPCGGCHNCGRVAKHIHPDIVWIEPIKKSRGILVEQIEEVIRQTFQTTYEGGWKAMVLIGAERMNNEAANKLLKTLEEPPPRSIFFLLSDQPEALLPTIVSRCQRVTLSDCSDEPEDRLRSAVFEIAAGTGGGGIAARLLKAREMVALLKKMRELAENETAEWLEKTQGSGGENADLEEICQGRTEAAYRERRRQILRLLLLWQRDLLVCAHGLDDDLLFYRSEAARMRSVSRGLTYARAMNNINVVEKMQVQLDQHLPELMVIERAFLQLSAGGGKGNGALASC